MELKDLLEALRYGELNTFQIVKDPALEGGKKLVIETRFAVPEAVEPVRSPSPPRAHQFDTASGIADYVKRYGNDKSVIFVDSVGGAIHAVLDEKSERQFEIVKCEPRHHPLWEPWGKMLASGYVTLDAFLDTVSKMRRTIAEPDGRELVLLLSQVKATEVVEIQRGRGQKSLNGVIVRQTIQGTAKNELVDFPEVLALDVPIFIAGPRVKIEIDLLVKVGADKQLYVCLVSPNFLEQKQAEYERMADSILSAFAPGKSKETPPLVVLGKPSHQTWKELPRVDVPRNNED